MADQRKIFSILSDIFTYAFYGRGRSDTDLDGVGIPAGDMAATHTMGDIHGLDFVAQAAVSSAAASGISSMDLPSREMGEITGEGGSGGISRRQRYQQYRLLEDLVSEIDAALNTYADEASTFDANQHVMSVNCSNQEVKEEAEFFLYRICKIDKIIWGAIRNLCLDGDLFFECKIDENNPELGFLGIQELDAGTMWRIQTKRGKVLEYQQAFGGPDYNVVTDDIIRRANRDKNPHEFIHWANRSVGTSRNWRGIRFAPAQVIHIAIGGRKRGYYPYGVSILAPARRPAMNLKLMEDAMLIYRLTRSPERRIYHVDVGALPGPEVAQFLESFKSSIKRKKIFNERTQSIDENWNPMSIDDDLFLPVRPNGSGTKVETLPGAGNLGEIDDTIYFRKKLYIALKIPQGFLEQTIESQTNRLSLSTTDQRFARVILRIQKEVASAFTDLLWRHFELQKVPREMYEDLEVVLTPSSDWQEMAKSEVVKMRVDTASAVKSLEIFDAKYIMTKFMKMTEQEADDQIEARRLEELDKAEMAAQVEMITAKARAEIDRANAINQARAQEAVSQLSSTEPGSPTEDDQSPTAPLPSEDEIQNALPPEPEDDTTIPSQESDTSPIEALTPSDMEAEWEDSNL